MGLDIFNNDMFRFRKLTASIQKQVYQPARLTELGWFSYEPVDSDLLWIDIAEDKVNLVSTKERGSTPTTVTGTKYESRPFKCVHLPQRSNILASELQNVRAFGSEDATQGVQMKVAQLQAQHKRDISLTMEHHMLGALKGTILDADGTSVILDIHSAMGTSPSSFDFEFTSSTLKVRTRVTALLREIDDVLGGTPYQGVHVLCSPGFFDALIDHPSVEQSWERAQEGANLRNDLRRGFNYAGVFFEEYRGGGIVKIADNEALAVPVGVDDMLIGRFAPADYVETVNTMGLDFYSKAMLMDFDKGITIESQSNPFHLNTRPDAVFRLTQS